MKRDIFNNYTKNVCNLFGITEQEIFLKSKKRNLANARHFLYYICHNRPMEVHEILKYMSDKGYDTCNRSVTYGVTQVSNKIKRDDDYQYIIDKIS
jgi:chromosomal replication initiation ATPase DnaA